MRVVIGDPLAHKVQGVYCDGVKLALCVVADEEQGYAMCYESALTSEDQVKTVRREGKIEIKWREDE